MKSLLTTYHQGVQGPDVGAWSTFSSSLLTPLPSTSPGCRCVGVSTIWALAGRFVFPTGSPCSVSAADELTDNCHLYFERGEAQRDHAQMDPWSCDREYKRRENVRLWSVRLVTQFINDATSKNLADPLRSLRDVGLVPSKVLQMFIHENWSKWMNGK